MNITWINQKTGEPVTVKCYPAFTYAGEEFVVHRRPDLGGKWVVSHMKSGHTVGSHYAQDTREAAKARAWEVVEGVGEAKVKKAAKKAAAKQRKLLQQVKQAT